MKSVALELPRTGSVPRMIVFAFALVFITSLPAAEITVFAAASLTEAMKRVAADYEQRSADRIVFNFAASSTLARQIEAGAPADLFFSADEAKMNRLEARGLIRAGSRTSLLSNALVIVVAAERGAAVERPRDLATDQVERLALAEPRTVPAGIYARAYLEQQGLWRAVETKVVPTQNVRGALAAVEAGNAEAGFVYQTDAALSRGVRIAFQVPRDEGPVISYPVALLVETRQPVEADRFLQYLASEAAAGVFETFGFAVRWKERP